MSVQTKQRVHLARTTCTVESSVTCWLASPDALCSVFLAGILFRIHSTNSVFNLVLYSYNFAATTMRPLVIATLASCATRPLILRPTAATEMLAARSSMCGFSIRNICHRHFKIAADYRNQRHSTMPFGMNAVKTVCLYKCYFNIRMEDCESFIRVGKHTHTHQRLAHTPLSALLFLAICLLTMATVASGTASGISWLS